MTKTHVVTDSGLVHGDETIEFREIREVFPAAGEVRAITHAGRVVRISGEIEAVEGALDAAGLKLHYD